MTVSKEGQLKLADDYPDCLNKSILRFEVQASLVYGSIQASTSEQINEIFGAFFFIGLFLFIIFMVGAVLIIHYKQISEGYEDHERFIILKKVGPDQKQIKQTINKQILTVFFLPVIFAFLHLAFSYHMLSLILKVIEVVDDTMRLTITFSICSIDRFLQRKTVKFLI